MASRLPPEALQMIFKHMTDRCIARDEDFGFRRGHSPRSHWSSAALRKDLWSCSLVCKGWRQWAQEALYTYVVLQKLTCVWFMETLEERPDLASRVTTLEISPPFSMYYAAKDVKALLVILPNLRWYRIHPKKKPQDQGLLPDQYQDYLPTAANSRLTRLSLKGNWLKKVTLLDSDLAGLPGSLKRLDLAEERPLLTNFDDVEPLQSTVLSLISLKNLEVLGLEGSLLDRLTISGLSQLSKFHHLQINGPYIERPGHYTPLLQGVREKLKILEFDDCQGFLSIYNRFRHALKTEFFGDLAPKDLVIVVKGVPCPVQDLLTCKLKLFMPAILCGATADGNMHRVVDVQTHLCSL